MYQTGHWPLLQINTSLVRLKSTSHHVLGFLENCPKRYRKSWEDRRTIGRRWKAVQGGHRRTCSGLNLSNTDPADRAERAVRTKSTSVFALKHFCALDWLQWAASLPDPYGHAWFAWLFGCLILSKHSSRFQSGSLCCFLYCQQYHLCIFIATVYWFL